MPCGRLLAFGSIGAVFIENYVYEIEHLVFLLSLLG